jgi:hypothetical protein
MTDTPIIFNVLAIEWMKQIDQFGLARIAVGHPPKKKNYAHLEK